MAKSRDPRRETAKKLWLQSDGAKNSRQLSEETGVSSTRIRKWKAQDQWEAALQEQRSHRRGPPLGSHNAKGHGAPKGNRNAQTHGAYSSVVLEDLPPEGRQYVETASLDIESNFLRELQLLLAKEWDLRQRISELAGMDGQMLEDREVQIYCRTSKDGGEAEETGGNELRLSTRSVNKTSAFNRRTILDGQLNQVNGRIIKLLDSMKSYELERRRIRLEEDRLSLSYQKATGVFELDVTEDEENEKAEDKYENEKPLC